MGERGQVTEVIGDKVMVRLTRTEACAGCNACAAGLNSEDMFITAKNNCGASEQDWVEIELEHANFLRAAGIMYGIPLSMLMAGFLAGFYAARLLQIPLDAPIGFAAGLVMMFAAYRWIHAHEERWKLGGFIPSAERLV